MAIHERDLYDTSDHAPAWPHPHDDGVFTAGCPDCDVTRAILAVEIELRLAVRDLWIAGWTLSDLADEMRRRTGSAGARDLIIHASLAEDAQWADQAKTDAWTRELGVLTAASGATEATPGWVARWMMDRTDRDAAQELVLDVIDELGDARRRGRR